jgi:phospholipase A2
MAGVSGTCWLQTLYHSSLGRQDFTKLVKHFKARLGVHIAFPPPALNLLTTAPTNKYLLRGLVEKLKGDPDADFGLVDVYGLLLAARLLIPSGELDLSDRDLKLSNQRKFVDSGANPLPIYTAVRHEIPPAGEDGKPSTPAERVLDELEERAKHEPWFQWFEFTPYELFCEELNAGIPAWAMGRHFNDGKDVAIAGNPPVPELRIPMLMGLWGSAFCATLAHYYKELRPVLNGLAGFSSIDALIEDKSGDLIRVHPIDPAMVPNFVIGLKDKLPDSCPASIFKDTHLRLMDAGMSNNLPIYPLLRPGRDVDIIIVFDASADIKEENWLSVVDGYVRQRGIKGWPIGSGWPKPDVKPEEISAVLEEVATYTPEESSAKLARAQEKDRGRLRGDIYVEPSECGGLPKETQDHATDLEDLDATDLSYCNVWLGTIQERISTTEPPSSKRLFHSSLHDHSESDFHLRQPDAGIALIYFPLLPNPAAPTVNSSLVSIPSTSAVASDKTAPGPEQTNAVISPASIDPVRDDFMSTWNFVYTPDQVDAVVGLAKSNFSQGEDQVKRVVRGVYERKKRMRIWKAWERQKERLRLPA